MIWNTWTLSARKHFVFTLLCRYSVGKLSRKLKSVSVGNWWEFERCSNELSTSDGKLIPKNVNLLIAPYFMARDPELFKNPLEFIPERFDVETTAEKVNPYGFIPFSAGLWSRILNFTDFNEFQNFQVQEIALDKSLPCLKSNRRFPKCCVTFTWAWKTDLCLKTPLNSW